MNLTNVLRSARGRAGGQAERECEESKRREQAKQARKQSIYLYMFRFQSEPHLALLIVVLEECGVVWCGVCGVVWYGVVGCGVVWAVRRICEHVTAWRRDLKFEVKAASSTTDSRDK